MKNIFKIHVFFYLFGIICIFNGLFKDFIYIMGIVLFHEIGHILVGSYYKWKIKKIVILPMGGITIFETYLNTKLKEEFLVSIAGPLFQCLLFLNKNPDFTYYNKLLLFFNLIPIIPLDGSKIMNVLLNKIFSFNLSYKISNYISVILIIILLYISNNLMNILVLLFLIIKTIDNIKKRKYIFNKFLFERYLYKFKFKNKKIVDNIYQMKKDYKHLFYINKTYQTEKEYLSRMFDKKE